MIYPIVIYGSDVLRKPCERITPDYPEVKKLVEDMFLTLGEAEGVGLAAPQIGKNIRLFIVDCTPWGEDDPECADYKRAFINPEIYALSEEKKTYNEGCLSFPGIHADVPRSLAIRMRYMDEDFVEHDEEFHGLKAWVIQHEYDHIEGIVFTDRISPLRRNLLKGKLMNLAEGKYRCAICDHLRYIPLFFRLIRLFLFAFLHDFIRYFFSPDKQSMTVYPVRRTR